MGKNDDDYKEMVSQIKAIVFLSTPHRGCNSAGYLDTLLRTFNLSQGYIKDLVRNGPFLQNINHDFNNICRDLKLFSFYETAKTSIYGVNTYVFTSTTCAMRNLS